MAEAITKTKLKFPKETYLNWYKDMLLMRRFEERAGQLYGQQKIKGFCHLYIGQEALVAGAMSVLKPDDNMITAYRDHAHALGKGVSARGVIGIALEEVASVVPAPRNLASSLTNCRRH